MRTRDCVYKASGFFLGKQGTKRGVANGLVVRAFLG